MEILFRLGLLDPRMAAVLFCEPKRVRGEVLLMKGGTGLQGGGPLCELERLIILSNLQEDLRGLVVA